MSKENKYENGKPVWAVKTSMCSTSMSSENKYDRENDDEQLKREWSVKISMSSEKYD